MNEIGAHEESWDASFRTAGVRPLDLFYEDLCSDLQAAVGAVLRLVGTERVDLPVAPELGLQRDGLNDEWAARYRRLARGAEH